MSACTTLNVSRNSALLALAQLEMRHLTDSDIESRLNELLNVDFREPLYEVSIGSPNASDEDELASKAR